MLFYLCPTENESISVSAEELLNKHRDYEITFESTEKGNQNF